MNSAFEQKYDLIKFYSQRYQERLTQAKDIHTLADGYYKKATSEHDARIKELEQELTRLRLEKHTASEKEREQLHAAKKSVDQVTIDVPFAEMARELAMLREQGKDCLRISGNKYRSVPIRSIYESPDPSLVQRLKVEIAYLPTGLMSIVIVAPGLGDLCRLNYDADREDIAIQAATEVACSELERRIRLMPVFRNA